MKTKKLIILITLFTTFLGCKVEENLINCTLEFVYGLNITLINANTSMPITDEVNVLIKDGNYEEVLTRLESDVPFFGAGERAGTYILTITSDTYKTFISEPIVIEANECHVIPKAITIQLEPIR